MKLVDTKIKGLKIIKSNVFKDTRGFLRETYQKRIVSKKEFPFDVMSSSKKKCFKRITFSK